MNYAEIMKVPSPSKHDINESMNVDSELSKIVANQELVPKHD